MNGVSTSLPSNANLIPSKYLVSACWGGVTAYWSTRTGALAFLDDQEIGLSAASPRQAEFVEKGLLVDKAYDEFANILEQNIQESTQRKIIDLVIVPSANCTFGCNKAEYGAYCGQTHSKDKASPQTVDEIINWVQRSITDESEILRVSWFGGEPLLALENIKRISASLLQISQESGIEYQANIVTGGIFLTPKVARTLYYECRVTAVSITLDGLAEEHDLRRCTKQGKPTFDIIVNNLRQLLADADLAEVQVAIRSNIDKRNIQGGDKLIQFIRANGWQDRVSLGFAAVHPWGHYDHNAFMFQPEEYAELDIGFHDTLTQQGFRSHLLPPRKKTVCRVVSSNSAVVNYDGGIHKCTESPLSVNAQRDYVGQVNNVSTVEDLQCWDWHNDVSSAQYDCANCVYLPVCGGGCPLSWRSGSDKPCPSIKHNGEKRLVRVIQNSQQYKRSILNMFSETSSGTSQYSILSLLGVAAKQSGELDIIDQFTERVRLAITQANSDKSGELIAQTEQFFSESCFTDWLTQKLENASKLSCRALVYYRLNEYKQVVESSERAIEILSTVREAAGLETRLAQIQILYNLLVACYGIYNTIDEPLFYELNEYVRGKKSIRIGRAILLKLPVDNPELKKDLDSLRESITEFGNFASVSCRV